MPGKKYLRRNPTTGATEEQNTPQTSGDSPVAGDVPALSTGGKLSTDLIPSTVISAGAGDAGKATLLDSTGRIDATVLPVGVGVEAQSIQASENLAAADWVNVWNSAGNLRVRKADASTAGKEANGFVLSSVTSGNNGVVYFEGTNTGVAGMTAGADVWLDPANPGKGTTTYPAPTAGQVSQRLGKATAATAVNFEPSDPITVA